MLGSQQSVETRQMHTVLMIGDWVRDRANAFLALRGQVIDSWRGVEMAVRGGDEPEPEFGGLDVPCLQLWALYAVTAAGTAVVVTTYQDDDLFGLSAQAGVDREGDGDMSGGYRLRALSELPTGRVQEVLAHLDDDVLAEVSLRVGNRDLLLVAGEAQEDSSSLLVWHRLDESVLVFTDPGEVDRMQWVPVRGPLRTLADGLTP